MKKHLTLVLLVLIAMQFIVWAVPATTVAADFVSTITASGLDEGTPSAPWWSSIIIKLIDIFWWLR